MVVVAYSADGAGRVWRRGASLCLVLLLHALLIALLLTQIGQKTLRADIRRETILSLTPPERIAPPRRKQHRLRPFEANPQMRLPPEIPPTLKLPDASALQSFGQSLNDCAPEKLSGLPAEARAKCPGEASSGALAYRPALSHSRYRAYWAATLAKRRTPLRAKCETIKQIVPPGMSGRQKVYALMVDPLCLLK